MGQGAQHKQQYQSGLVWLVWKQVSHLHFYFPVGPDYIRSSYRNIISSMHWIPSFAHFEVLGYLICLRNHKNCNIAWAKEDVLLASSLAPLAESTTFTQLCLPWVQMRIIQTYSPHHLLYFAPFWLGRDPVPRQYFNALCVCYLYAKAGWFCT